jgi:hypothetical protein
MTDLGSGTRLLECQQCDSVLMPEALVASLVELWVL